MNSMISPQKNWKPFKFLGLFFIFKTIAFNPILLGSTSQSVSCRYRLHEINYSASPVNNVHEWKEISGPIFFTSDHHFNHSQIISHAQRPFSSFKDMNYEMEKRWNQIVPSNGTVFHLGDFALYNFSSSREILSRLNGYKILLKGNHDWGPKKMREMGFSEIYPHLEISIGSHIVLASHFPYRPIHPEDFDIRFPARRLADDGSWLLHGHVHHAWKIKDRMINLGVEHWNYEPVPMKIILSILESESDNP